MNKVNILKQETDLYNEVYQHKYGKAISFRVDLSPERLGTEILLHCVYKINGEVMNQGVAVFVPDSDRDNLPFVTTLLRNMDKTIRDQVFDDVLKK